MPCSRQMQRTALHVLMAAAINLRAISVLATASHDWRMVVIVMLPAVNWRCPQFDPLSSSDMSGEDESASLIRARKSVVRLGATAFLKLGFASIASRSFVAKGMGGRSWSLPVLKMLAMC